MSNFSDVSVYINRNLVRVNQEPAMVPDVDVMMKAIYVFLVQGIVILVSAVILACCVNAKRWI